MATENTQERELRNEDVHFEPSDLDVRHTFITGASVLIGIWVVILLLYFVFTYFAHQRAISSPPPLPIEAHGNPLPPQPRLQQSPRQDLKALRAREDWELNHYFWVDKTKGRVAIPIERAMDILATGGIPPQQKPPNLVLSQPQAGTRATGFEGKVEPEPR
ncbi:MAG: hypothetical protein JO033_01800 [Acidobacteriaceae bacterium]|nr:hypothetical protein [Acidobacteriaceae bacterium]MBV9500710.1 hypothetical protein [Acidobacteriaceae bacterium]